MNFILKDLVTDFDFPVFVFAVNQIGGLVITLYYRLWGRVEMEEVVSTMSYREALFAGLLFAIAVPISVWSLKENDFTENQLYKILTLPLISISAYAFMGKEVVWKGQVCLGLIFIFAVISIGIDHLRLTFGMIPGALSIITTSFQQLYSQYLGKKYGLDGMSFLAEVTPYAAFILEYYSKFS